MPPCTHVTPIRSFNRLYGLVPSTLATIRLERAKRGTHYDWAEHDLLLLLPTHLLWAFNSAMRPDTDLIDTAAAFTTFSLARRAGLARLRPEALAQLLLPASCACMVPRSVVYECRRKFLGYPVQQAWLCG